MFSGNEFVFRDVDTEFTPEKVYQSEGRADTSAVSWWSCCCIVLISAQYIAWQDSML